MNPESLRRFIAEMIAERLFELEMSNWRGNNI